MSIRDELYALINEAVVAPYPFTERNLALGEVDGVAVPTMIVTGITGKGFTGEGSVTYDKIVISDLVNAESVVRSRDVLSVEAFIELVNATWDMRLEVDDLEPITLPEFEQETEFLVPIVARDDSLGWYGSANVRFAYGTPLLSTAVYNRILSAMVHPPGYTNTNAKSGRAITYNLDLTVFRDELTNIGSNRRWVSITRLNQYLQSVGGITLSNNSNVVVGRTADVAGSNTDYDFVIHYTGSVSGGSSGLYLHWLDLEGRANG